MQEMSVLPPLAVQERQRLLGIYHETADARAQETARAAEAKREAEVRRIQAEETRKLREEEAIAEERGVKAAWDAKYRETISVAEDMYFDLPEGSTRNEIATKHEYWMRTFSQARERATRLREKPPNRFEFSDDLDRIMAKGRAVLASARAKKP